MQAPEDHLPQILTGLSGDQWVLGETIDRSQNSRILIASNAVTDEEVAVKCVSRMGRPGIDQAVIREVDVMQRLGHPHVLRFIEYMAGEENHYIVMELASGGDLYGVVVSRQIDSEEVQRYFTQMMQGVAYLHSKGIAHRDLKPENLLLTGQNQLRIADFGLSVVCVDERDQPLWFETGCGTRKYCAPELLQSEQVRYQARPVDIWAAAVVLYVLARSKFPFAEASPACKLFYRICQGDWGAFEGLDDDLSGILKSMFCVDPQKRMNCEDVLGHTYCQPFGQSPSLPPQDVCEDAGKSTGWERISSLDYNDEWEDIESFKHAPRIENASELADVLENFELPVGVQDPRALLGWSAPEHPAPPTPPSPASRLRRKSPYLSPLQAQARTPRISAADDERRRSSLWEPRPSDLTMQLPLDRLGTAEQNISLLQEVLKRMKASSSVQADGICAVVPVLDNCADPQHRSSVVLGEEPTSIAHDYLSELQDESAVVEIRFKIVFSGDACYRLVARRIQGNAVAYHDIFAQIRSRMSEKIYNQQSPEQSNLPRLSNPDLGKHIKRLRSVQECMPPEPAKKLRQNQTLALMSGYHALARRMQNALPLESRWHNSRKYHGCFAGRAAMDWMFDNEVTQTEGEVMDLGTAMAQAGFFYDISLQQSFSTDPEVYFQWSDPLPGDRLCEDCAFVLPCPCPTVLNEPIAESMELPQNNQAASPKRRKSAWMVSLPTTHKKVVIKSDQIDNNGS